MPSCIDCGVRLQCFQNQGLDPQKKKRCKMCKKLCTWCRVWKNCFLYWAANINRMIPTHCWPTQKTDLIPHKYWLRYFYIILCFSKLWVFKEEQIVLARAGTAWFMALVEMEMKQVMLNSSIVSCHAEEIIKLCEIIIKFFFQY